MLQSTLPPCSILLLAGGRGSRMGGQDKGLIDWQGLPLIAHLHALVRPLSDDLIISCNRNHDRYRAYADQLVSDADTSFPGPLAGIRAALQIARHPWLLVLPCDTPALDAALLTELRQLAVRHPAQPCLVREDGQWQPLVSVIPRALAGELETAWQSGERSPLRFFLRHAAQALDCPAGDPRLANLNTPQLLRQP